MNDRLEIEVQTSLADSDVARKLGSRRRPYDSTPSALAAQLDRQTREVAQLVGQIGIRPE
jgi:hypothetical protein